METISGRVPGAVVREALACSCWTPDDTQSFPSQSCVYFVQLEIWCYLFINIEEPNNTDARSKLLSEKYLRAGMDTLQIGFELLGN